MNQLMSIINLADEPEHIPTLATWHDSEWAHLNPGRSLEQRIQSMQAYLGGNLIPSTFIYKHQDRLAGSAAITASDMDNKPQWTPWLASVFVEPSFRNQGIGSQLVRHVMTQALRAGITRLYLFTPDRAAFYQKLGWTILLEDVYRGHAVTVMRADLFHATNQT